MSTDPQTLALLAGPCTYCGDYHAGQCPTISSIEYHPNGAVKRIEFHRDRIDAVATVKIEPFGDDPSSSA